jgi:ATP/maltotriose-dependent transcriptional regulator MalT
MPKPSQYALVWSETHQHYELHIHGHPEQWFSRGDELAFARWLDEHTAFAFLGQVGRISLLKEARRGGRSYWYACRTHHRHTRKRYLGQTAQVSLARLEEVAKALSQEASPAPMPLLPGMQNNEQPGALLSSKLSPPRLPLWLVERSRLLRELDAVHAYGLTLLSASAGSGKTTLLSAWVAASSKLQANESRATASPKGKLDPAVAWLSLDALDDDPIRFWASCIEALRTRLPKIGQTALALLHSPEHPPLSIILTHLLNEIVEVGRDIILILDDYHVISEQAIHDSLLFLLDHLPARMHLMLATRTDPELPLSRFRVRGQLIEIRSSDLRFTQQEVTSFLSQSLDFPLPPEDVAILSERTEGWIAGLQLAALSMRKRQDLGAFVKDFAGSHRFVLDYVQQDILARLPVTLQHFLLQTSILTHMNAAVCQVVTASPSQKESQQMLEEVERANLFVVPLDSERQWYRYHELFREALRARLHAAQPELVPLLHLRAASFYEAVGEWHEAIVHALAAPDYTYAACLMEQAAKPFWLQGEVRTVYTWVFSLPDPALGAHLRLALDAALRFVTSINLSNETLSVSMVAQVERTFTRLEGLLRGEPSLVLSEAEVALIHRRLRVLRALIEAIAIVKRGDTERLWHLVQGTEALPPNEEESWNLISLFFAFWLNVMLQGEGASLIHRLLPAKQLMMEAGDPLVTIRVMTWLALVYIQAGQLHLAQQEALSALALVEQVGRHTITSGYLYYCLFNVSYAWNRLDEASDWLRRMQQIAEDWQQVDLLVRGKIFSAEIGLARKDLSTAHLALHQLEALVEQEGFAIYAPWVSTLRVHVRLEEANLARVSEWATQTTLSPDDWNPVHRWEVLTLVRVYLVQQQYARAVETLESFRQHFDRPGDIQTTIHFLALYVVALHHDGKRAQASRGAVRLLALTEPEGNIRVFLNEGEPMKRVLQNVLDTLGTKAELGSSVSVPFVSKLLAAFEQEEKSEYSPLVAQTTQLEALSHPPRVSSVSPALAEPLTQREQEVLRLLADGASNQEIANKLVIELSTVKKHVSNLLSKLGAENRTQAVAQARACSLL